MRRVAFMAGLLAAASPTWPDEPRHAIYYVERVSTVITDDEKIGVRRMGVFCLPAGALHWKDILPSRNLDQREIVEDALEDAGLPLSDELSRAGGAYRIKGAVTAADFRVCAKLGALRDAAVVGDVALDVEWRLQRPGGEGASRIASHVSRHLEAKATLGTAYRDLLTDAAKDLAGKLKATGVGTDGR